MELNAKISVIVPAYNMERHIGACLTSLLNQSYSNLEILVVDDGSTDQTRAVVETFLRKDSRIQLFCIEHSGVAAARNIALNSFSGDWVTFCDSDDIVPKHAYQWMLHAGYQTKADVIVGTLRLERENEIIWFKYHNQQDSFTKFYYGPSLCNRLFRKSVVQGLQFKQLNAGEDIVFLTEIYLRTRKISAIKKTVYIYKNQKIDGEASLTHTYSVDLFKHHIDCWKIARRNWKTYGNDHGNAYLIQTTIPYLYHQLLLIPSLEAKCKAFELLKSFLKEIDWEQNKESFQAVLGVPYDDFSELTAWEYFDCILAQDVKERVLLQFQVGQIGFRYIVKYFKQWMKYKLHTKYFG